MSTETACPPPKAFTTEPADDKDRMLYALDKKLTVVCNKIDNVHEDMYEMKTDIRELRNENREQNKVSAEHISWKHFIIILIAVVGFIGGAYAYTYSVDGKQTRLHLKNGNVVEQYQPNDGVDDAN